MTEYGSFCIMWRNLAVAFLLIPSYGRIAYFDMATQTVCSFRVVFVSFVRPFLVVLDKF